MNRGRAQQELQRFAAIVRRAERSGGKGRNFGASISAAERRFEESLRAVVAVEDAEGVEAAAALSDRLTALRQRATDAAVLSAVAVRDIERRVLAVRSYWRDLRDSSYPG